MNTVAMLKLKSIGLTLWSAAAGSTGKETALGGVVATIGIAITDFLGGWDKGLQILMVLMLADYISGLLGAIKTRTVNSDVMFWGGIRKITALFVIGLAALIDGWLNMEAPIFRTAALYFYAGREGLSVVENLGTLGVPLPPQITKFLVQLQEKGEGK